MRPRLLALLLLPACGPTVMPSGGGDDVPDAMIDEPRPDAGPPACHPPPNPAGPDVQLAPEFAADYAAYDLGTVPGVPNPLGGAVVKIDEQDRLLIAGGSESPGGAIYSIGLERDACGHILGFVGTAELYATTAYVDANLVYKHPGLLVYSEWPQFYFAQLDAVATAPVRRTDLRPLGMDSTTDSGPGGLGFVPPGLAAEDELRMVTWPEGRWYHVTTEADGALLNVTAATQTQTLTGNPGGFAYVPAGSPGFAAQSLIVSEWNFDSTMDRVAVYDVDDQGDPMTATRREFFTRFPRPWGAYFEPVTGDYLFLSWGTGEDHVYLVQGFVPPPIID